MYFPSKRGLWRGFFLSMIFGGLLVGRRGGYDVMGYHSLCTLRLASFCEWEIWSGGNN